MHVGVRLTARATCSKPRRRAPGPYSLQALAPFQPDHLVAPAARHAALSGLLRCAVQPPPGTNDLPAGVYVALDYSLTLNLPPALFTAAPTSPATFTATSAVQLQMNAVGGPSWVDGEACVKLIPSKPLHGVV